MKLTKKLLVITLITALLAPTMSRYDGRPCPERALASDNVDETSDYEDRLIDIIRPDSIRILTAV